MSRKIVAGFGMFIVAVSLFVVASPNTLPEFAETFLTPAGLGFAAAFRILLGLLLWAAADASRTPRAFRVLGVLFVIGGLAIPLIGVERMTSMVDWGKAQGDLFLRLDAVVGLTLGAFFVWSTMYRRPANSREGDA